MNIITPTILSKKIINKYFDLNKTIINIKLAEINQSPLRLFMQLKSKNEQFTDTISKEIYKFKCFFVHRRIVTLCKKKLESLNKHIFL